MYVRGEWGTVRVGKQNWNLVVFCRLHLEFSTVPNGYIGLGMREKMVYA